MNAESEMAGADGLGGERPITMQDQMGEAGGNAANLDPCAQIAESVGYSDGADDDEARCDNCRRIWAVGELVEPKRLSERLDPGGTVPAGECPECGAFAYLLDDRLDKLAAEIGYSDGADDDERAEPTSEQEAETLEDEEDRRVRPGAEGGLIGQQPY
jgi:hypothetical protein